MASHKAYDMPRRELHLNDVSATARDAYFDPATETLDRPSLRTLQLERVQALVEEILPRNAFYTSKLGAQCRIRSWDDFCRLPLTTKAEIAEDQLRQPPYGTNRTYPL